MTVYSKEENSQEIYPNYVQEFGLCLGSPHTAIPTIGHGIIVPSSSKSHGCFLSFIRMKILCSFAHFTFLLFQWRTHAALKWRSWHSLLDTNGCQLKSDVHIIIHSFNLHDHEWSFWLFPAYYIGVFPHLKNTIVRRTFWLFSSMYVQHSPRVLGRESNWGTTLQLRANPCRM